MWPIAARTASLIQFPDGNGLTDTATVNITVSANATSIAGDNRFIAAVNTNITGNLLVDNGTGDGDYWFAG